MRSFSAVPSGLDPRLDLIPGLKAWAIFKSPSGTNRKVRCAREDKKGRFVRFLKNCSCYPGRYECFDSLTGFRSIRFATAQGYSRIYQTGRASLVAKEFAIRYRNERIGWGLASLARRYAVPARSGCRHLRSHFEKRRQTPS